MTEANDRSPLEPLDADLAALFARERDAHPSEALARDEMLSRVERMVRVSALAGGAPTVAAGISARAKVAIGIALAVVGAGAFVAGRATAPAAVQRVAYEARPSPSPSVPPVPPASQTMLPTPWDLPPESAAPRTSTVVSATAPRPTASIVASDLAKEQELIDTARVALARHRGNDALEATQRHAQRFPHGVLSEEREALAIQALVAEGQLDAARARAEQFKRRYPQSIFGPSVDRALAPR
ncbi:MAG TPA: hypothetical protein VM925_03700 [Labilithrix sp.]|nr:hypothetical protein [Labilithrix sp.]